MRCTRCEVKVETDKLLAEDWTDILYIPWCSECYPTFWNSLKQGATRKDYFEAHVALHPTDFRAQDGILVALLLAPVCTCNQCRG